jgi:dihydrofolate reductase
MDGIFEVKRRLRRDDNICFYRDQRRRFYCATERRSRLSAGGRRRTARFYEEFMASVDTLVISRKTFETVLKFAAWPYGDKRVVVLSGGSLDSAVVHGGILEQMAGSPADIVSKLAKSGADHVYVDGGITIQRFLRAGLVHRLIITRVPVLIGEGIPLFGALPRDLRLRHVATQHYPSGLVKSEYHVA